MLGFDQYAGSVTEANVLKVKKPVQFADLMPVSLAPQDSLAGDVIENICRSIPSNFLDTAHVTTPDIRFLDAEPHLVPSGVKQQLLSSPENETAEFVSTDSSDPVDMQDVAILVSNQKSQLTPTPTPLVTLSQTECNQLLFNVAGAPHFPVQNASPLNFELSSPKSSPKSDAPTVSVSVVSQPKRAGGKLPRVQRRSFDKDTEEYKLRRERNNIAVRKSRNKAKLRQELIDTKNNILEEENQSLKQKMKAMKHELELLQTLCETAGLKLPSNLSKVASL